MCDRLLDQLELGSRVAQSLVVDNDLSPIARHAALCWRATAVSVAAAAGPAPGRRPARPGAPVVAGVASAFRCAA